MPRWRRWTDDDGSASLEFVTVGLILLVPLVYLVLTLSAIQAGSLAVEGAARQAVRVFVQADTEQQARDRAGRAIEFALADYGVEADDVRVSVSCAPHPDRCLTRLGTVTVTVGVSVPLPLVPPALSVNAPLSVPVQSSSTERVSRFWGAS